VARERLGFWQWVCTILVPPTVRLLTRRTQQGLEHIPEGGTIIVANHVSHADPLIIANYVHDAGRWPRFLAKDSIFRVPFIGMVVTAAKQIPVVRGTVDAAKALEAAVAAVEDGGCVIVYPEGTTTKEPNLWPMRGKTGAARLWLTTGAPVVPLVVWGPQQLFDPRTHKLKLRRTPVTIVAGEPLDLSKWAGASPTPGTLMEITDHIMLTLRDMLAEVRGGTPPPLYVGPARRSGAEA
jgi:1-acyl-sn-glycerol-3-phosphate acyltransferase